MAKLTVSDLNLEGKKVLMRVDFNVPIKDGVIGDDNRIQAALPTIKYVLDHKGKAILCSHLGRIKKEDDKKGLSLRPVAERLSNLLNKPVIFCPVTEGKQLEDAIAKMEDGSVLLFENTRYEDVVNGEYVKRESGNDPKLGEYWASLADEFINDAFGTAHRSHASNAGIAEAMHKDGKPVAAGFLMEKEIQFLGEAVNNPQRPFVAILGGAKVSDKIGVIDNLLDKADKIIIGGGMTYTFYAAKGIKIETHLSKKIRLTLPRRSLKRAATRSFSLLITWLLKNLTTMLNTRLLKVTLTMVGWLWISVLSQSKRSKMSLKMPRRLFGTALWVCLKWLTTHKEPLRLVNSWVL